MSDITFSHPYSKEDLLELNSYVYYHTKSFKLLMMIISGTFLYFLVISILDEFNLVFLAIYLFLYLYTIYINPALIKKRVLKSFQTNQFMKINYDYVITDSLIKQFADNYQVEYKYDQFIKVIELKKYFYLFVNAQQAMIIPKNLLDERFSDFKDILINKIPSNIRNFRK